VQLWCLYNTRFFLGSGGWKLFFYCAYSDHRVYRGLGFLSSLPNPNWNTIINHRGPFANFPLFSQRPNGFYHYWCPNYSQVIDSQKNKQHSKLQGRQAFLFLNFVLFKNEKLCNFFAWQGGDTGVYDSQANRYCGPFFASTEGSRRNGQVSCKCDFLSVPSTICIFVQFNIVQAACSLKPVIGKKKIPRILFLLDLAPTTLYSS
jgi:hypothetical protein